MKLLSISSGLGYFLSKNGDLETIDKITKEDLLRLVGHSLNDNVEIEEYDESTLQNQAHRIIYKDIYLKLVELVDRRDEYADRSDRMFLDQYDSYKVELTASATSENDSST